MVLDELNPAVTANSPTKRKFIETHFDKDERHRKLLCRAQDDKENYSIIHSDEHRADMLARCPASDDSFASQETLADEPESQDTIPDSNLPSSSSNTGKDGVTITPPDTVARTVPKVVDAGQRTQDVASQIKCRLKLAMYKMRHHKEELNYRSLMPRKPSTLQIGALPTPSSSSSSQKQARTIITGPQQHKSTGQIMSIVSDERSVPVKMHRSSSGDLGFVETPIRRNHNLGLSSPPASQESLQLQIESGRG